MRFLPLLVYLNCLLLACKVTNYLTNYNDFSIVFMAIVTLISDMGNSDHYVASVKGTILSKAPEATIVDITHQVPPFNIPYAGFVLKSCFNDFPKGTVHIIGVLPEPDEQTNHLAILYDGHYFIGADNGIFSLLFDREPDHIVALNMDVDSNVKTFPTKTVFAPAAAFLARGGTLEVIGNGMMDFKRSAKLIPTITGDVIKGNVIHIDHYGNIITNISKTEFETHLKGRSFEIIVGREKITQIHQQFNEQHASYPVAVFSANGLLELAICNGAIGHNGSISQLFGVKIHDVIRVEFI